MTGIEKIFSLVFKLFTVAAVMLLVQLPSVAEAEPTDWVQVGADLEGTELDSFGNAVILSRDGNTMAVSADGAESNDAGHSGRVTVYRFDGSSWNQLGSRIGAPGATAFGEALAITDDGATLAVGNRFNDAGGDGDGRVRVYRFNGGDWIQVGADIEAVFSEDGFGSAVAMSADGGSLVVGAPDGDFLEETPRGQVRVYSFDGSTWVQQGTSIAGPKGFGTSVATSSDGALIAVSGGGQVQTFSFDDRWVQVGTDIVGEAADDGFGSSLAMSADGTTLVARAQDRQEDGEGSLQAQAYRFDGADWVQLGNDIDRKFQGPSFTGLSSVGMSDSGDTIILSSSAEKSQVYRFDGDDWVQLGRDLEVGSARYSGVVAISGDGQTVAVADPSADSNGSRAGRVRTYRLVDEADSPLGDGNIVFLTNAETGRFLDSDGTRAGWNVKTSKVGRLDDQWQLVDNGDDTWSLLGVQHGRYLDADGPGQDWNVAQSVIVRDDDRWEIIEGDDGFYTLRNARYDRYLNQAETRNVTTVATPNNRSRWQISPAN